MKLYNSLSRQAETFKPLNNSIVKMYSCGPTVYDYAHIGNLSSFIYADILKRALITSGLKVEHVMNFTDVDDKTIKRSQSDYPDLKPEEALHKLTKKFEEEFIKDIDKIGIESDDITFIRATESINDMIDLIKKLYVAKIAYIAEDGIYFSIKKYIKSGKTYGQLIDITPDKSRRERISNDEYDKDTASDFALWKKSKSKEPSWPLEIDGHDLAGRPGWHIECSAMSKKLLGQPFDIHTGGVDLRFPHHENEIAQSTAVTDSTIYAKTFVHNNHLLVDGKKMSKSLNNFYTLKDVTEKGYAPKVFRLFVLQSHYRSQSNFTWQNLDSAASRLKQWLAITDRRWQTNIATESTNDISQNIVDALSSDLDTPKALSVIDNYFTKLESEGKSPSAKVIGLINDTLGINLRRKDITHLQKELIITRENARDDKNWQKADEIRDELLSGRVEVSDTPRGTIWHYNQI